MTVALGIIETRRAFSSRPSLVQRAFRWNRRIVRRFLALFRRGKPRQIHAVDVAMTTDSALGARAMATLGTWDDVPLDERVNASSAWSIATRRI